MEFELRDGRKAVLIGHASALTYYSALQGSPERLTALYRLRGLENRFIDMGSFAACSAAHVFDPGTPALPPVQRVAYLRLFGEGQPDDVYYSELLVGWFADDLEFGIGEALSTLLKDVDWDARASVLLYSDL